MQRDRLVTDVSAYLGEFGDPFDKRDPTLLTITAHYPDAGSLDRILATLDEELARVADDGLDAGELDRVRTKLVSMMFREMDAVITRALNFAKFELIYERAELIAELPDRLSAIGDADVQAAARALQPDRRAIVELIAGGGHS